MSQQESRRFILETNVSGKTRLLANCPTRFSYPLTKDFVLSNFNGFQVESGQSILIVSVADKIVYKKPMMINDVVRVWELLQFPPNDKLKLGIHSDGKL